MQIYLNNGNYFIKTIRASSDPDVKLVVLDPGSSIRAYCNPLNNDVLNKRANTINMWSGSPSLSL